MFPIPGGQTFADSYAVFTTKFRDLLPGEVRPSVLEQMGETDNDRAWVERLASEEGVHGLEWHTTWWGAVSLSPSSPFWYPLVLTFLCPSDDLSFVS